MKNKRNINALNLILLMILSLTLISATQAQSTDMDNPTALTSNIIEGEGDGNAETVYYIFIAEKGDVKVTVDAKTDDRSTPLRVALLDEDGKELLPIYVVAKGTGQREVGTKRFVRDTKVILRIRMDDDKDVKLLTYKIKLDGAVKVETPLAPTETTPTAEQTNPNPPTEQTTNSNTPTEQTQQPAEPTAVPSLPENQKPAEANPSGTKTKDKVKKKAKKEAKKIVDGILDN
jgi:hypothetical protein